MNFEEIEAKIEALIKQYGAERVARVATRFLCYGHFCQARLEELESALATDEVRP